MSVQEIETYFPRLRTEGYTITSPETEEYNCIAWAADDTTEKWDPNPTSGRYWPPQVPRTLDLESFVKLYEVEGGYVPCADGSIEEGFEKIVIFLNLSREVSHAAKQLPSGQWTSKLGNLEDIEHNTLWSLEGDTYGFVAQYLKRPRAG